MDKEEYKVYWREFRIVLAGHPAHSVFRDWKVQRGPHNRLTFDIGYSSRFTLFAFANTQNSERGERFIGVALALHRDRAKALEDFGLLKAEAKVIQQEIGRQLVWIQDKGQVRVAWREYGTDADVRDEWPEQHRFLCDALEKMYGVFLPRIHRLAPPK